ncbi:outer membrane beta-barrel family protein [Hymenobacter sp. CRA2]|uniref:outer membrane beta-barrel family protein n=1 Tax=Hymenobacter sp. CRA2 TaxID=1955620 RepID=UPI0009C7D2E4|nr:outer membrane beta-barrel family protein [Hymenobacter sp. CRA2]OON70471.1 hypothetical protein B0919_00095 [Hymenobacter sp. CRA2]
MSLACAPLWAQAQSTARRGTAHLSGTVVDATTQKPVEYATVALLPAAGEQPLAGTAADAQGQFVFKDLAPGSYRLALSFVGYAGRTVPITLAEQGTDLGPLPLTAAAEQLGEVNITGEREVVETRPDRLVYNADRDVTNTGGTAADVLRKTPLLSVDADGNVQLRGSSNLRILLNNKPSALLAGNLAEALKQIPADQIKAVEVLTAPSAKYDGEGSAGVVNIVLKKSSLQGVNGNVGAGVGNRNQNLNGSISARRGQVGGNASASLFANQYPARSNSTRLDYLPDGEIGRLDQQTTSRTNGAGGFAEAGLSYDPSEQHGFTLTFDGSSFLTRQPQQFTNQYSGGGPLLDTLYARSTRQRWQRRSFDLSSGYTRTFAGKPGREWAVLARHSRNRNTQGYQLEQYPGGALSLESIEYQEQSRNLSQNLETTLQTDYTRPVKENVSWEAGGKVIWRRVSSDYTIDTLLKSRQTAFARSVLRSNGFHYQQNVGAAYGTYNFAVGKQYRFSLGTRLEYTDITGEFRGENGRFANYYTNLLPSLSTTRNLKKPGETLRLSYSRRIQRPDIYYLNPFIRQLDPRNITYGNPQLSPEVTDNYELTYSTFGKSSTLNATAYTRRTNTAIEQVSFYNGALARTESTYRNIARNQSYGLSLYGSLKPTPKWQIGLSTDGSYTQLRSPTLNRTATRLQISGNLNTSLRFGKGYTAQAYAGYASGGVLLQARYSGGGYYTLGLKRTLLKDKLDLTLNVSNFAQRYRVFRFRTRTPQFETAATNYYPQRSVRLSLSYRFGKTDPNAPQRQRRSIRNDDQKAAGNGGQGG